MRDSQGKAEPRGKLMPPQFIFLLFIAVALLVIAVKSLVNIKEGEFAVVFRLGRLSHVQGPGLIVIVPFIDKVVRIRTDQIPNWGAMPPQELERKVKQMLASLID